MDCSIYPKVLNNQGEPVDSNLFKEIFKFTKDRQVAKKYYLATKTSRFKAWFGNSQFTDNNGEPQVYFNEDGEMVLINDKDDVKAVFNNGTWGLQNTQQDIINYLAKEGIINKNRIYGQHVLPRPHTGSDMLENVYRNKTKPETKVSLNKIAAINEEISMKYNVFGNLIEVTPFGKTYKVNINATVLSQLNETNQNNMHFMPTGTATVNANTNTQNAGARFINYKEQKKNLVTILENRIVEINNKKKSAVSSSEIIALNRVKSLIEARLNGNANQAGLYQELVEIESATVLPELEIMVGKDFDRVERLILSDDYNDLAEADEILNFYIACNPSKEGNPLFTEPERAVLTAAEENTLNNWATMAEKLMDNLIKKKREALVNDMNQNISVQKTLGNVTVEGLRKPMPDASAFDKWLFDPTNGVFSHNGPLPQVMKMNIEASTSEALSVTKRFSDEIKPLSDKAKEAFKAYNKQHPHNKISWDIYFQKDIDGSETGRLVSRYSRKWEDAEKRMHYETDSKMYENLNNPNYTAQQKASAVTTARKNKIQWYKHNGLILNLANVPEIIAFVNDPANGLDFLIPHFTSEDPNNTLGIQGNHRTELIEKQKDLLMQFKYNYETYVEEILDSEGVADINALSAEGKGKIETWFHTHNPANAFNASLDLKLSHAAKVMRNGQERTIVPELTYVVKFPVKKFETSKYAPKGTDTHYYDDNFGIIDKDSDLYKFHGVAKKAVKFHKDVLPARDQREIMDGEIGMINKAVAEVFTDKTLTKLQKFSEAGRILWDRIRRAGWIQEQSINDRGMVDATSSTESKSRKDINKGMLLHDRTQINAIFNTEVARFVEDYHSNKIGVMTRKISRHTTIHESLLTVDNIAHLAEVLGVPPNLADIKLKMKIETGVIPVGRILYNFATNKVVSRKSRNLPKMLVFYTDLAANYAARTQIKPSMDTAMELYTSISREKTQNTGLGLRKKGKIVVDRDRDGKSAKRENAITQVESWYDRAVLGNYESKHFMVSGQLYTKEEKKQIKEIDDQISRLSADPSEAAIIAVKKLEETKRLLGHKIALSQFLNSLLKFTRLSYLGWAVNSAITNFLEGQVANEIAMAMEIYYPADNWYIATRAVRASQWKFATKKLAKNSKMFEMANFTSHFMDRYTVLQDSRNEFQKAEIKTSFSLTAKLDPMLLNQSVEYANQAPILLTAMMSEEIEDEHGNKSTVYEAFDKKTMKLKPEFRKNPDNIKNWEEMRGDRYHAFKSKLTKVIVDTHGDYDKLRGNLAKTTFTGKALLMFKGWLPRAIYNRFAVEQWDIETQRKHKGRYLSHTPISGGIHGALVGAMIGPLFPIAIGAGVGVGLGMWAHKGFSKHPIGELWTETHILARRMIGMPLNRLTGGRTAKFKLLNPNYRELISAGIVESKNELDAKNLMGNLAEMAMQLTWMAIAILAKSFFYDEDDEKNSARRLIHNFLVNRALTMANQATMYLDPSRFWKDSVSSLAILRFLNDVKTFLANVDKAILWNDVDLSQTDNRGKSRLLKSAKKLSLVPIRGRLGFDSQFRQPILPHTAYERAFWSDYKRIEKEIEEKRIAYQIELEETGIYTEAEIKKMKNKKYPTLNQQLKTGKAVYGITQDDIKEFREIKKNKAKIKKDRQKEKDKEAMERKKAMEAEINR